MKDLSSFNMDGKEIFSMDITLLELIEIPFSEMTWPKNLPLVTLNMHFLGLRDIPNS